MCKLQGKYAKYFNVQISMQMAALDMEDMLSWMQDGGQVGIFDATNSTRERRNMLMKKAEGKCKVFCY